MFERETDGSGKQLLHSRFDIYFAVFLSFVLLVAIAYFSLPRESRTLARSAVLLIILGTGLIPRRRRLIYGVAFAVAASRFLFAIIFQPQHRLEFICGAIILVMVAWALLRESVRG